MKDTAADIKLIDRLNYAATLESLPQNARDHATHLLSRLTSPVRVTLLGLPGAGKSEVFNLFAGERILPKDSGFPTTELAWGDVPSVSLTGPDGARSTMEVVDPSAILAMNPAFVSIRLPLPILKRIRLLEPDVPEAAKAKATVNWALQRTDIALWCTQEFGPEERALWEDVPDALKDHAFLVLTKADVLSATGNLTSRISGLADVVAEEFHAMFALATLQALKALKPNGEIDSRLFEASGGEALRSEIVKHAERGRRADFDSAEVFLVRHEISDDVAAAVENLDTDAPVADVVKDADAKASPKPEVEERAVPAKPEAEPEKQPVSAKVDGPEVLDHEVENVSLFTDAAQYLRKRGEGLASGMEGMSAGATTPLVEQCMDAVDHLIDLFSDDDSGCPAADAFLDELNEATDLMVLMQIESGDAPAADAVTVLLQLRRDIETKLAA